MIIKILLAIATFITLSLIALDIKLLREVRETNKICKCLETSPNNTTFTT